MTKLPDQISHVIVWSCNLFQLNTDFIKFDEYVFVHGKKSSIFYFYELTSQNKSAASFLLWTFTFFIFIFVHFNVMVWVFCLSFPLYFVDFISYVTCVFVPLSCSPLFHLSQVVVCS